MGHILYCSPRWFYGYDIILEIVFAIITFAVAMYSFRIYRLSGQRDSRLFGFAFLLISASYSLWAILNGFAVSQLESARTILELERANIWRYLGIYAHILFFLGGMSTLTYMTFKNKNLLLTLGAFIFLFLGRFEFIFSPSQNIFYVIGHILEFTAYILILASLITVIKQGNKGKRFIP